MGRGHECDLSFKVRESAVYLSERLNICLYEELEELVVCVCSYVLLEHEAGQQGGGLFNCQVIEEAVEHHLRQQELITTVKINTQVKY